MKRYIKAIKNTVCLSLLVVLSSCSIDDIKPINQLTKEDAIRDEASAQLVLNGVYDLGRVREFSSFPLYLAAYGNEGEILSDGLSGSKGFNTNNVPVDNPVLANFYNGQYKIINSANFLIERLEAGDAVGISEVTKNEMISEAKVQRALTYFNLLRYFGQFYDLNSEYGVVVRTEFAKELTAQPRNTVQEVYTLIKSDLEYAAANGPTMIDHFYTGSLAAKALLSKVELTMGNYGTAASLAFEVINNSENYALEGDYASIFLKSFNSSEVIFAPISGPGSEGGTSMDQIRRTSFSETLENLSDAQKGVLGDGNLGGTGSGFDPRFSYAYAAATKGPNGQGKYPFGTVSTARNNTMFHLRLGEIYLVHAEAEARRSGGDLDVALESLNTIRLRAGVTEKILSDKATLLEDVRQEKLLELFFENGEPWFDLVRYDILGNIDASSVKPTLISRDQFVLPIPLQVIIGNTTVKQNPGY